MPWGEEQQIAQIGTYPSSLSAYRANPLVDMGFGWSLHIYFCIDERAIVTLYSALGYCTELSMYSI